MKVEKFVDRTFNILLWSASIFAGCYLFYNIYRLVDVLLDWKHEREKIIHQNKLLFEDTNKKLDLLDERIRELNQRVERLEDLGFKIVIE